jgi:PAS domain-containing protein
VRHAGARRRRDRFHTLHLRRHIEAFLEPFIPTIERTSGKRSCRPRNVRGFELEYRIVLPARPLADDRSRCHGDERRKATHGWAGQDITERKEAEERLLARRALSHSVEQLPLASYVEQLDAERRLHKPSIADLVGYTAEEWLADSNFFAASFIPTIRTRPCRLRRDA